MSSLNKPVICYLHGLNCSSKIFNHLQAQLPEHDPVFIDYESTGSFEDSYNFVLSKLPKKKPFSIVSHSLGGMLGYLIAVREHAPRLQNLVTISSPFGGSRAAGILKWMFPNYKIFKDLAPSSKIVNEIAEYGPSVPFLSLVSTQGHLPFISADPNDGVVSVASQTSVYPDVRVELDTNHFEALLHPETIAHITDFLFQK